MNKSSSIHIFSAAVLYCMLLCTPAIAAIYSTSDTVLRFQKTMAAKGVVESQYTLGFMYETGLHVEQSIDDSIEWYDKASAQDYQPAIDRLTYIQIKSTGFKHEHIRWLGALKEKARANDKDALFLLGQMYSEGTAVNKSLTLALKLLRRASRSDRPEIESEIIRVETELAALQQQYQPAATSTNANAEKASPPVKTLQKNTITPDAKKEKDKPIIKNTNTTSANTPTSKPGNIKPQPSISNKVKHTNNSSTNSITMSADKISKPTIASTTKQEIYTHPMDIMCGGSYRLMNGCR